MVWRPFLAPRFDLAVAQAARPAELPRGHIPALDAIRGLAIVVVTLYRFGGGGDEPARAIDHPWLIALGQRGVDLFFVLSGFLITGILFDAKGKHHYFRNFYMRRALRIFPLYYAVLIGTLVLLPLFASTAAACFQPAADAQGWLWLYGANVLQSVRGQWCLGPLNHFWSLAIEEHFYLIWPAVIYSISRQAVMRLCGLLFIGSTLSRAAWLAAGGNDVAAEVLTLLRMDGLVLGSWLALAARGEHGFASLVPWAKASLFTIGPAAIVADIAGVRLLGLPSAVWACACGAMLVVTLAAPRRGCFGRLANSPVLRFFGKYSYAMYVFQLPLIYIVAPWITAAGLAAALRSPLLGQLEYALLMFTLTTLAALVSWHVFEKRLLSCKRFFEN